MSDPSEAEVVFKDVSVEEMMEIIAENQGKSIIETFNVEYSNLEAAYLNLLKSKGRRSRMLELISRNRKVYTRDRLAFFMSFLSVIILILVYQSS